MQHQRLLTDPEKTDLDPFPVPSLPLLTIVQLDLLHSRNELVEIGLVGRQSLKTPVVKLPAPFHEKINPTDIETASQQKDHKDLPAVPGQDNTIY